MRPAAIGDGPSPQMPPCGCQATKSGLVAGHAHGIACWARTLSREGMHFEVPRRFERDGIEKLLEYGYMCARFCPSVPRTNWVTESLAVCGRCACTMCLKINRPAKLMDGCRGRDQVSPGAYSQPDIARAIADQTDHGLRAPARPVPTHARN